MKCTGTLFLGIVLLIGLFTLGGCEQKPLPEGLTVEGIDTSARTVLDALNARDYEAVTAQVQARFTGRHPGGQLG